jgi:hypothetical protein
MPEPRHGQASLRIVAFFIFYVVSGNWSQESPFGALNKLHEIY